MPNREGIDQVLQALADPTRRQMVERLVAGPASVRQLAEPFAMSLPAVMQHLGVLEGCGLVRSHKAGRVRTCELDPGGLRLVDHWVTVQRMAWERRLDRLGDFLSAGTAEPLGSDGSQAEPTPTDDPRRSEA